MGPALEMSYERAKRLSVAYRCFLVTSALVVLVAVAVLSTASRTPYSNTNSAAWHTSKASRMNECRREEAGRVRTTSPPSTLKQQSPVEASYPVQEEELLPNLPSVLQAYHFRSPPMA
jgi:hypothetical protein